MASVFERMIADFGRYETAHQLEQCMTFNQEKVARVPLRYRLIAMGFVGRFSLEEMNKKLTDMGCEQLYARNLVEASLIFAFRNSLSYSQWKKLEQECEETAAKWEKKKGSFADGNITFGELKDYVMNHSLDRDDSLQTRQITRHLQERLLNLQGGTEDFAQFLETNRESFSLVREKTRYYFCKFLYYYIERKIDQYLKACSSGFGTGEALAELSVLKCTVKLRRKTESEEEIRRMMLESGISCGNLYDAFNYFYFDYVSSDWMDVLIDYYGGDITMLPGAKKNELAHALRAYNPEWKDLDDEEVIRRKWQEMEEAERELDQIYSLEGTDKGYQKNRSGEKSVRNYIKGTLDIDRTTLICYLLFFGQEYYGDKTTDLTRERIEEILTECGFPMLRDTDEFDSFVIRYLDEQDPVSYLMDEVTNYAMEQKNFFLYHMYRDSVSNDTQIRKVMGVGR